MNTDELRDRLQALPPALDNPPGRFEVVRHRVRRRRQALAAGTAAAVVVAGAGGAAMLGPGTDSNRPEIAPEVLSPAERVPIPGTLPGVIAETELGTSVTVEHTGTGSVHLGARPAGATAARIYVTCLTAGRITFPDGALLECDKPAAPEEVAAPRGNTSSRVDLGPEQTSFTIRAKAHVSWKVVATYVRTEATEWGVNAKGETFGVDRDGRIPDLIAAETTDGKPGYVYAKDLEGPTPKSPAEALALQEAKRGRIRTVPVYLSDGETVIGEFHVSAGTL